MTRPNILIFMPDQLRADAVGCFGGYAETPNIDALAARGVRFSNAFSQNSVCSPSRVSMLTGWYPHVRGHRTLYHLIKPDEPNLLRMFRDAGYHVAWAGKRGDTFAPGVTELSTDRYGYTVEPTERYQFANKDPDSVHARAHYHGRRTADGVVLDFDEAITRTAVDWLTEGLPEPWVLFCALIFPHTPFEVEEPWYSQHDRAAMTLPYQADLSRKPAYMRRLNELKRLDRMGEADWRELRATYAGMISRVDSQLGRVLAALEKTGADERTLKLFYTDHGEYLGDFGLVEKWPAGVDDCLVRNPLIIAGPGVAEGVTADGMVEMVDLLPTLAERCELTVAHTHFGKSLADQLAGKGGPHKDAAYSEGGYGAAEQHQAEHAPFPYDIKAQVQHEDIAYIGRVISIRTADWTYVHRVHDQPELYDRKADPGERFNRAGEPALAGVEADLKARLLDWLVETSDVIPWVQDPRFDGGRTGLLPRAAVSSAPQGGKTAPGA